MYTGDGQPLLSKQLFVFLYKQLKKLVEFPEEVFWKFDWICIKYIDQFNEAWYLKDILSFHEYVQLLNIFKASLINYIEVLKSAYLSFPFTH